MEHPSAEPRLRRAARRAGSYCEATWHWSLITILGALGFCIFLAYQATYALPRSLWRHSMRQWHKLAKDPTHLPSPVFGDDQG